MATSRSYLDYRLSMPKLTELQVVYESAPGAVVRQVHHKVVGKVAKVVVTILKETIRELFPLYPSGKTRADGRPLRWERPTGAMEQSIGLKTVPLSKMRRSDSMAIAYVGSRTDFTATKTVKARVAAINNLGFKQAPKPLYIPTGPSGSTISPYLYLHLAAFGHGPGPKGLSFHAEGQDFMSPTIAKAAPKMRSIVDSEYSRAFDGVIAKDSARLTRRIGRTNLRS